MKETQKFISTQNERLDSFLSAALGESRSQIAAFIKNGYVLVDDKVVQKSGLKLKENQVIEVTTPHAKIETPMEIDFDVAVLYEDDALLVINKPTNLTVHEAPSVKEPTLVDWLKHKGIRLSNISGEERNGIVHRLDKGTSGAMVVAKTNEAHQLLSKQLEDKSMGRYYLAVITPPLKSDMLEVEKPIMRSDANRLKMACGAHGKYAKTEFRPLLLSKDEKESLIACKLYTGRTHQIRVHLESLSRHIVGDHLYGATPKQPKSERILLHAYLIYFIHPITNKKIVFEAPIESQMRSYLERKFDLEQIYEVTKPESIFTHFSFTL